MDELPASRGGTGRDADAPLGRDDSDWFSRQLGEDWQPEEPGIYRFVGHTRLSADPWGSRIEDDADRALTQEADGRWPSSHRP